MPTMSAGSRSVAADVRSFSENPDVPSHGRSGLNLRPGPDWPSRIKRETASKIVADVPYLQDVRGRLEPGGSVELVGQYFLPVGVSSQTGSATTENQGVVVYLRASNSAFEEQTLVPTAGSNSDILKVVIPPSIVDAGASDFPIDVEFTVSRNGIQCPTDKEEFEQVCESANHRWCGKPRWSRH